MRHKKSLGSVFGYAPQLQIQIQGAAARLNAAEVPHFCIYTYLQLYVSIYIYLYNMHIVYIHIYAFTLTYSYM
jgi:hypothetical protein